MWAAAEGRSTLGIPRSVGEEFVGKDRSAAGTLFVAPSGRVLMRRRAQSDSSDLGGYWDLPGGSAEPGETPWDTAQRESQEEVGFSSPGHPRLLDSRLSPDGGLAYHTLVAPAPEEFWPQLSSEHDRHAWVDLSALPAPLHPGLAETLSERLGLSGDCDRGELAGLVGGVMDWLAEDDCAESVAMDRDTVRSRDSDGHLHVNRTPISKANVCPYYGREIPGAAQLGLDMDRVYMMYRDPEELERGAATFARKPLLLAHKPVSSSEHPHALAVGTVGDDVRFDGGYLTAPLTVWDGAAIALIESGEQRELSSAYRYRADMTPGEADGVKYDGVMRDIVANHVALVREGRAGPDVVVGDSRIKLKEIAEMAKTAALSRMGLVAAGAMMAYLAPRLAQDAKVDVTPALAGVTSKNFGERREALLSSVSALVDGKLAKDANISDLAELLNALSGTAIVDSDGDGDVDSDDMPPRGEEGDGDPEADAGGGAGEGDGGGSTKDKVLGLLAGKLSEEDLAAVASCFDAPAADEDPSNGIEGEGEVNKAAMDAAIEAAKTDMRNTARAIRAAEAEVRPVVGELTVVCDSAADVYRAALKVLGVPGVDGLHADALRPIFLAQPRPGARTQRQEVALDASAVDTFHKMFPGAAQVRTI